MLIEFFNDSRGPIQSFSWGNFTVNGVKHEKDLRLIGDVASQWAERKRGRHMSMTGHFRGSQFIFVVEKGGSLDE